MGLLKTKQKPEPAAAAVQTGREASHPFWPVSGYTPLSGGDAKLYEAIREAVPLVDAALTKIVRLAGGFRVECGDPASQRELERFCREVKVGAGGRGLETFLGEYLDSLLTYGNAVGEIVLSKDRRAVAGLYNASLSGLQVRAGKTPFDAQVCVRRGAELQPVKMPQLVMFTALNPPPSGIKGESVLKSLPFVTSILLKIFDATGKNFDRVGNVRFAVTYKPGSDMDRAYAKERTQQIAREWSQGMSAGGRGQVRDFVSVGDVDIKVIGADNQILDTQVPVRQMLEQIIAKLSIPPFLLGLNWSTTERMSKQQADILTSELEYYRRLLTPVLMRVCRTFLRLRGCPCEPVVKWNTINLQDEVESAKARLYNAQAEQLERQNG